MQFTSYSVGLVLSRAGLNAAQLTEVKARLRFILKSMTPGGDGLSLIVPTIHDAGPAGADKVETMVAPLQRMDGLKIIVAENVCEVEDHIPLFRDCDEVWCCPSVHQDSKRWRARRVYDLRDRDPRPTKYQLIPPWVEPAVPEAKTRKER